MQTTKELEKNIKQKIYDKIPNINLQSINFIEGNDESPEGIYVFTENDEYIFIYTEKGKIRERKVLNNENDLMWSILNSVLFKVSMEYAIANRRTGEDFRKALFIKEIELFSLFGDEFKKRKIDEIESILLKNPYNDSE